MDLFGKILVFVVFGMSLLMAAVGGVAYYNRVDWTDTPAAADGSTPAGELLAREEKLDELRGKVDTANKRSWSPLDAADVAWREGRAVLPVEEEGLKLDQAWYAAELEHLRTDPNGKPILALDYQNASSIPDPNKKDVDDPTNKEMRLKMAAVADRYNQPLLSLKAYAAKVAEKNDATAKAFEDFIASSEKDTVLTLRLNPADIPGLLAQVDAQLKVFEPKADDDASTAAFKKKLTDLLTAHKKQLEDVKGPTDFARGLDQRIQDEKVKQAGVADELKLVLLGEGQVRADSQLLLIRKKQLEKRVQELEKPAASSTP